MSFDIDVPEADDLTAGGDYLEEPGTYHLLIDQVRIGESSKGNPIDGFSIGCSALGGTVAGCEGKICDLTFFKPDRSKEEKSQKMTSRVNSAFAIAANLIAADALGKRASIDPEQAKDQQIVVTLEQQMEKDNAGKYTIPTKYLRVRFADIYHVDDPDVAKVPKNADAIAGINPENRRSAEWFAFKQKKGAAKPASGSSGDDFTDI